MKVSQYNSIYDFPSNPSQKLMFNENRSHLRSLIVLKSNSMKIIARLTKKSRMRRF